MWSLAAGILSHQPHEHYRCWAIWKKPFYENLCCKRENTFKATNLNKGGQIILDDNSEFFTFSPNYKK